MKIIALGWGIGSIVLVIARYFIRRLRKSKNIRFSKVQYIVNYSQGVITSFLVLSTEQATILCIVLISIIIVLTAIDIIDNTTMIIPDGLLCILAGLVICYNVQYATIAIIENIIGMCIVSMPMLFINLFVVEAFGGGDIKLMIVIGLFLGWQKTLLTIVLATLLGGVYVSSMIVIKKTRNTYIPFAPYLCKSALIAYFFSEQIWNWYFNIF
jgi:Type II secretory pathway, prepilin signal peptidase PulO and related peptidases